MTEKRVYIEGHEWDGLPECGFCGEALMPDDETAEAEVLVIGKLETVHAECAE